MSASLARFIADPKRCGVVLTTLAEEMPVQELAELVLRLTGSASQVELRPLPVDDPRIRQPDITRARSILGWSPQVPLEQGLVRTIEFFRQQATG